jgi:hypothetical protein
VLKIKAIYTADNWAEGELYFVHFWHPVKNGCAMLKFKTSVEEILFAFAK